MVQKGDNLYSIARKLNTTVEELKKLNNLSSNNLQVGDVLRIPSKEIYENEDDVYIVKKGDSLYKIAQENNTTVDEIKKLNNLTSNNLSIGQLLKLPSPLIKENTYTVKPGDSLYSISRKYNVSVEELKKVNDLKTNFLSIGDKLIIPNKNVTTSDNIYIVQKGDSLYRIAMKYNTTVEQIKKLNNLTSNNLSIGQKIKIPRIDNLETTYVVKKGDSLYSVAKKYNLSVEELKRLNNLDSNMLSIGQILIVG